MALSIGGGVLIGLGYILYVAVGLSGASPATGEPFRVMGQIGFFAVPIGGLTFGVGLPLELVGKHRMKRGLLMGAVPTASLVPMLQLAQHGESIAGLGFRLAF
jgi:hypothetical protein